MNITKRLTAALLLAFIGVTSLGAAERSVHLTLRIFQVPRTESWDVALPETSHGIADLTCRGDSTAAFPDGTLCLATELAERADSGAITDEIMNRVIFGNGYFRAKDVSILEIGKWEAKLAVAKPTAETEIEREKTQDSRKTYGIRAELRPAADQDIAVELRFDAGSSYSGGRLGVALSSTLFSETVVVPEDRQGKLLLIGFPSHDEAPRGTIYWLAICATSSEANSVS